MAKRRGPGDGSIYRDKTKGRYIARIDLETGDGRRTQRKRVCRTYSEAREALTLLQKTAAVGVDPRRLTVGAALAAWLTRQERSRKARSTISNYRWAIEQYLVPQLGGLDLGKLQPAHVDAVLANMANDGRARNTMNRVRSVLVMALDDAVARRLTTWNPAAVTATPDGPRNGRHSLTEDQARWLLECAESDPLEVAWALMLTMGLRPGEACGVAWNDIDLDEGTLTVRQARLMDDRGRMSLGPLKTEESHRTLHLDKRVVAALERQRSRQEALRAALGASWHETGLVVTTSVGTPVDRSGLRRAFGNLTEAAGLGRLHPTVCRHTYVSLCAAAGVPEADVADAVGHKTTRMTHEVYRHQVRPAVGERTWAS